MNLKFPSFCVNILITVFFRVLKIKINLVKLTFLTAFSSHQVLGTKGVGYVIDIPWIVLLYLYVEVIKELQIIVVVVVVVATIVVCECV